MLMKFDRNFADILEKCWNLKIFRNFRNLKNSSENSWILKEFWLNSDLKSSNGSVPRRSNLSTQARLTALPGELENAYSEASEAIEEIPSGDNLLSIANLSTER